MMNALSNRGANRCIFVLLYLTCVVLSLAPSVVGPPERNFNQGQPELQQSMDNMIVRDEFMKRSHYHPSSDDLKVPSLLSDRTAHLLEEAQSLLTLAKDLKEKEWLEDFIHKLKQLASTPQQTNKTDEKELNTAHEAEKSASNSKTPFIHLQHQNFTEFALKTVPESKPGLPQSHQMTSKLPDVDQVKSDEDYAIVSHVTKPGFIPSKKAIEKDELVEELESLHKITSLEPFNKSVVVQDTSSTSAEWEMEPSLDTHINKANKNIEIEKEKIKERLASEVAALKELGETNENILNAMHIEGFKSVDSKLKAKETEINKNPSTHSSVKRILDENRPNDVNQQSNQLMELPRQNLYMNNTFLGMHINLPQVNPRVLRRQFHYGLHRNAAMRNFQFHHGGLQNTIQKLQTQNNQNFLQRNHMFGGPNFLPQGRPDMLRPGEMNPYGAPQSDLRYPAGNPAMNQYINPNFRALYMPYPLNPNLEQKSDVVNDTKSTTYSTDKLPTELSEDMKRQLRDGKVLLLSDSVVRSNFTSDTEKNEEKKTEDIKQKKKK